MGGSSEGAKEGARAQTMPSQGRSKDGTKNAVLEHEQTAWTTSVRDSEWDGAKNAQSKDAERDSTAARTVSSTTTGSGHAGDGRVAAPIVPRSARKIQKPPTSTSTSGLHGPDFGPLPSASPADRRDHPSGAATRSSVSGRYIIVRPQTHEIVYIIEG
jgi:hypothetical protein